MHIGRKTEISVSYIKYKKNGFVKVIEDQKKIPNYLKKIKPSK